MKAEPVQLDGDLGVANAARRSFNVEHAEFRARAMGPRTSRGRSDEELIEDLADNSDTEPFCHVYKSFACEAPIPVARQLGKHQVGFAWSEVSRRYKIKDITFHRLDGTWRSKPDEVRQGSGPLLPPSVQEKLAAIQARNIANCSADYEEALALRATPEQARFLLPQSMNVVWTWTGSLLGWAYLYRMRSRPDAQRETVDFAEQISASMAETFPVSWAALIGESQ